MDPKNETLFDSRIVRRSLKLGTITEAQYKAYLAGLEDCADEALPTETRFVATFADRNHSRE